MKLFGLRSYVDAPPAPKMPPGLVELLEGLTKEVLKNNPTEVYEFCAEHMRKLLELRDHNTPKRCLTLEEKVLKANTIIRQRAEQRRQRYDAYMQKLQQSEQLANTNEIKSFNVECLPIKAEVLLTDNLKSHDEKFNNNSVPTSESIEHQESDEKLNDKMVVSEVNEDDYSSENKEQVKSDDQSNKSIVSCSIHPVQCEVGERTNDETKRIIETATDDSTKEECLKEIVADETCNVNEENSQEKLNQQGDIENESKDKIDYVNEEFLETSNDGKCKENDNFTPKIVTNNIVADAENSQTDVDREAVSDEEIRQEDIKDEIVSIDDGNQNELKVKAAINVENNEKESDEQPVSNEVSDNNEIKDGAASDEKNKYREIDQSVTGDEGNQNEIKKEAVTSIKNEQNGIQEQTVTGKEVDRNEIKEETPFYENEQKEIKEEVVLLKEKNQKVTEEEPAANKYGDQYKIKQEAAIEEENKKKQIAQSVINEASNQNEIKKEVVINSINDQKEKEEHLVADKESDRNKIKEEVKISVNNQKEIKEDLVTNNVNEQNEQGGTQQEGYHKDVQEQVVTNDENIHNEKEGQNNSNDQNDLEGIKVQGDVILVSEIHTEVVTEIQDENGSDINLKKEIIEIVDNGESIITSNETKSDESVSSQDKTVFETKEDISKDRPKDELYVINNVPNKGDPEDGIVVDQDHLQTQDPDKEPVNMSGIKTDNVVDEIIDKPLILNIDLQQSDENRLISLNNNAQTQNMDKNNSQSKGAGIVESKHSKPMDLETAAITIQKVFRNFLFRSKTSSFEDSTNIEFNIFDHDSDSKDTVYSNHSQILNKDKRPIGISRMDTVLQTVNEEKSLSLSTDDSSTLSSAATVIQAHIRGFLVRNRLNRNKTISSTSLADSDEPPASFEADPDPARSKTVLNIHIVPEGSHFISRDESMLTSVELSLDGSPPASSNLHPLGYDKSERRKQLKREDAFQSISPPSNNSTRLSEEHDSVKEVLLNDPKKDAQETVSEIPVESTTSEDSDSDDVLFKGTVEEKQIENQDSATTLDKKSEVATIVSSDELDVVTPFENVEGKSNGDSDSNRLVHSGEFHDVVLPTKVSRNDTSVVRGE